MVTREEALKYHADGRAGKTEVVPTKPCVTQRDLSLAYTPGVAEPCMDIHANPDDAYLYTAKGNLVAVVTNGTAVLGLGNIGALAGKPVMEGKGVLFKRFADIDVFDIELNTEDPDDIVKVCKLLEPTFGGINLEDIKAPECFYIEETLKEQLNIPVFHDDQHGTAIISGAALLNALELVGKDIDKVRVVYSGAGAAGIACARLYCSLGINPDNILMVDSKGVIYNGRDETLNKYKAEFARDTDCRTLADAMKDADVFVGVSMKGLVTKDMVKSMAKDPIIFAMANPDPEITYDDALDARKDVIVATGRSDYPNQVNNVLGFPFIFRGALDTFASSINDEMKIAAVKALADLARENVPEMVMRAYGLAELSFGREYIIPKPFDPRILVWEASAVAQAAMETGVARKTFDIGEYRDRLEARQGTTRAFMRRLISRAKQHKKKLVFPEGDSEKILKASRMILDEHIADVILLGREDEIREAAKRSRVDMSGMQMLNPSHSDRLDDYAKAYFEKRKRKGVSYPEAYWAMRDRTYFGTMMVEKGDADALLAGVSQNYPSTIRPALRIIELRDGISRVSGLFLVIAKHKLYFFADTTVNIDPTAEELAIIAECTANAARAFNVEPRVALLSFSHLGTVHHPQAQKVRDAVNILKRRNVDFVFEGELHADMALLPEMLKEHYPFAELKEEANVLIFPDLNSGNIAYKLMRCLGGADAIGPLLMGLKKPVHVLHRSLDVNNIVDMAALAAVDAEFLQPS
jgi:malate dehydrogenase (oxaloacetate-decarboxylating)(NADP+)